MAAAPGDPRWVRGRGGSRDDAGQQREGTQAGQQEQAETSGTGRIVY
jgi:hypothetical protein